jgi:hypothetical protein
MSSECQYQEKTRACDYCDVDFIPEQLQVVMHRNGWNRVVCDDCIREPMLIITYKDGHSMAMTQDEADKLHKLWEAYNKSNSRTYNGRKVKLENYFLKLNKKYDREDQMFLERPELFRSK